MPPFSWRVKKAFPFLDKLNNPVYARKSTFYLRDGRGE